MSYSGASINDHLYTTGTCVQRKCWLFVGVCSSGGRGVHEAAGFEGISIMWKKRGMEMERIVEEEKRKNRTNKERKKRRRKEKRGT